MEIKQLALQQTEIKFVGNAYQFSGYASMFGGVDSYGDTIESGAYKNTLENRERPVRMRWNHYGDVIGKWTSIREDEKGLYVEGELTPGHSKAADVFASMKHGAVDGLSIGYRIKAFNELENNRRLLKEIE
jgi:HK97 family phage prohead protease